MPEGEGKTPPQIAEKRPQIEESRFRALFAKLRKRRILETLAAFVGGGWLLVEVVERLLGGQYKFPVKTIDLTVVSLIGALLATVCPKRSSWTLQKSPKSLPLKNFMER